MVLVVFDFSNVGRFWFVLLLERETRFDFFFPPFFSGVFFMAPAGRIAEFQREGSDWYFLSSPAICF